MGGARPVAPPVRLAQGARFATLRCFGPKLDKAGHDPLVRQINPLFLREKEKKTYPFPPSSQKREIAPILKSLQQCRDLPREIPMTMSTLRRRGGVDLPLETISNDD